MLNHSSSEALDGSWPLLFWASIRGSGGVEGEDNQPLIINQEMGDERPRHSDDAVSESKENAPNELRRFNLIQEEVTESTESQPYIEDDIVQPARIDSLKATEEAFRRGVHISSKVEPTSAFHARDNSVKSESSSPNSLYHGIMGKVKSDSSPMVQHSPGESVTHLDHDARKYKLFFVPPDVRELQSHCFKLIGEGSTACIKQHCTQVHRSGKILMPLPGEAYVMKSRDRVFVCPKVNLNFVDSELVENWRSSKNPLNEWSDLLDATMKNTDINRIKSGDVIKESDIKNTQDFNHKNLARKTPAKRKLESFADLGINTLDLSQPSTIMDQAKLEAIDGSTAAHVVDNTLRQFDSKIRTLNKLVTVLRAQVSETFEEALSTSFSLDSKFSEVNTQLGKKPKLISDEFDGPDVWSVISEVIFKLQNVPTNKLFQEQLLKLNQLHKLMNEVNNKSNNQSQHINDSNTTLSNKINDLTNSTNSILRHIHKELSDLWNHKNTMGNVPFQQQAVHPQDIVSLESEIDSAKKDIRQLSATVHSLSTNNDDQAIRFNKMGFKSFDEAGSWYKTNTTGDFFGLVVDFHTLMENINNKMTTIDIMSKLEHVYKIKLDDLSQATSMGSYESEVPKVFMKEGKGSQGVINGDESHFTNIKAWDA